LRPLPEGRLPAGGFQTLREGMNGVDPTLQNRSQVAVGDAQMLANGAMQWNLMAGGVFVSTRVGQLRAAIPAAQQGRITMAVAVVEDSNGARSVLVATSEPRGYLRPGVSLRPGETLVAGTGHAEADIIAHARANNLRIIDIGATRPICPDCRDLINPTGANISTPLRP
jgi:multidrug efflux pump subunit AcrA (membrane-fusion protein)